MADKAMLQIQGMWIDLAQIAFCWINTYDNSSSGPYCMFCFVLKGIKDIQTLKLKIEEKEQFEEFLNDAMSYYCSTRKFKYEPPPPVTTTVKYNKPKGYLDDVLK